MTAEDVLPYVITQRNHCSLQSIYCGVPKDHLPSKKKKQKINFEGGNAF